MEAQAMPRLKQPDRTFPDMRRLLLGYELTAPYLSKAAGISESTAARRLANPGDLTLTELRRICRNGGIPADRIREAIKFE
jgi:hypothetical protein